MATTIRGLDRKPKGPALSLAAFGKHPAWDDHIEDQGIDTDRLVETRRVLYVEGIGANIDSGAWDKLPPDQAIAAFGHVFLWTNKESVLVGRMWASSDGKGRTKYPLVVVAQCSGLSLRWSVRELVGRLEAIEARCRSATTKEQFKAVLDSERQTLRSMVDRGTTALSEQAETVEPVRRLASAGVWGDPPVGLHRVLYAVEREMGAFRAQPSRGSRVLDEHPQHFRAPTVGEEIADDLLAWRGMLSRELAPSAPTLVVRPLGSPFVDVFVGDLTSQQAFCLRAGVRAVALTSDVPYTLDETFVRGAQVKVDSWKSGRLDAVPLPGASPSAAASPSSGAAASPVTGEKKRPKWFWFGSAGVALASVVGVAILASGSGNKKPEAPSESGADSRADSPLAGASSSQAQPDLQPQTSQPKSGQPRQTSRERTDSQLAKSEPAKSEPANSTQPSGSEIARAAPSGETRPADIASLSEPDPRATWQSPQRAAELSQKAKAEIAAAFASGQDGSTEVAAAAEALRAAIRTLESSIEQARAQVWSPASVTSVRSHIAQAEQNLAASERALTTFRSATRQEVARQEEAKQELARQELARQELANQEAARQQAARDEEAKQALARAQAEQAARQNPSAESQVASAKLKEDQAHAITEVLDRAESLLRGGRRVDEVVDGASVASLLQQAGEMQGATPELVTRFQGMRSVLQELAAIDGLSVEQAGARVREALTAGSSRFHVALEAWRRATSPAGVAQPAPLGEALALLDAGLTLRSAAQGAVPVEQRDRVESDIQQGLAALWTAAANRARSGAEIDAVIAKAASTIQGDWRSMRGLSPATRFNLERREVEQLLSSPDVETGVKRERIARLREVASANGAVSAAAQSYLAGIEARLPPDQPDAAPALPPLTELGPGSAGWKGVVVRDGEVEFQRGGQKLVFARVGGPGPGPSLAGEVYLSTTEISVGAARVVLSAPGFDASTVLGKLERVDTRRGPRTWTRDSSGNLAVVASAEQSPTKGWMRDDLVSPRLAFYAPGVEVDVPSEASPMQHLTPTGAVLLARAFGCRVPTPAEWQAMYEASGGAAQHAGANLRDATWRAQFDHARSSAAAPDLMPGAGAFSPEKGDDGAIVAGAADGVLWFRPVGEGGSSAGPWHHIIGNVAEYVAENEQAITESMLASPMVRRRQAEAAKLSVIGGSALSPPGLRVDAPARAGGEAYSDVGLRLAFSAAPGTGSGRENRAANPYEAVFAMPYLDPGSLGDAGSGR
ncbi:MAG: hypothetical protein SFZ23_02290 [Planctomycetota bacterium]|nr:hypothetical protein [Planctomycetota bacterium]